MSLAAADVRRRKSASVGLGVPALAGWVSEPPHAPKTSRPLRRRTFCRLKPGLQTSTTTGPWLENVCSRFKHCCSVGIHARPAREPERELSQLAARPDWSRLRNSHGVSTWRHAAAWDKPRSGSWAGRAFIHSFRPSYFTEDVGEPVFLFRRVTANAAKPIEASPSIEGSGTGANWFHVSRVSASKLALGAAV